MSVGRTTSNVEIRSLATSRRRSSSSAYSSRTLPLPTCVASDMNCFLLRGETAEPVECGVEIRDGCVQVEDVVQSGPIEPRGDLVVGSCELGEVALLVPGTHGVALHEAIRVSALQPALDEGEQQPVREEETVRRP